MTSSAAPRNRREADSATAAWFHELVREVEVVGDAEVNRARAPLFEKAHRPHVFTAEERRRMDRYEGIDYAEGQSLVQRIDASGRKKADAQGWLRLFMFVLIGVTVGAWSLLLFQTLDYLSDVKLEAVQGVVRSRSNHTQPPSSSTEAPLFVSDVNGFFSRFTVSQLRVGNDNSDSNSSPFGPIVLSTVSWWALLRGYLLYVIWGLITALLSSLCCLVMPSAAGSGIPDVMAYLNGVMFPRIFNIRNLVVKTLSCILAVSAGLPVGTEGPMIHMGSLIGAGLPTGRSRSLRCSATSIFDIFRNPRDQRDFISAGAACGLTSAFSSPLGGMLFVMEEMATHFSVRLAWLVFISCLSCMWIIQTVNSFVSGWHLVDRSAMAFGNLREAAMAMFYIDTVPENTAPLYSLTFIPTAVVAVVSGVLAVAYTISSVRFSRWRGRWLFPTALYRVLEPCLFAFLFSSCCYLLPLLTPCVPTPPHVRAKQAELHVELFTAFCAQPASTHHPLATLTMTSPYNLLRLLFSRHTAGLFPAWSLLLHLSVYVVGSSYAGGMFISCGTVIPSLLIGAVQGRLIGVLFRQPQWADEGVVALVGAAAYFAAISRLTFALVVIMMELTADVSHVTCIMLGVLLAKGIADKCCHSFYHASLEVKAVPFLEAQTSMHLLDTYTARDIMTSPVVNLETIDTVLHVLEALTMTTHNAFPVVRVGEADQAYEGVVTRTQLQLLLWVVYLREVGESDEVFLCDSDGDDGDDGNGNGDAAAPVVGERGDPTASATTDAWAPPLPAPTHVSDAELKRVREFLFWNRLPQIPMTEDLPLATIRSYIDLSPYIDRSAPYVQDGACVSRAYYTFRHLGLRHLPVVDRTLRVVGMLTRVNFVGDRLLEKVEARQAAESHGGWHVH
ncbi:putative chloride channel protein [Leptomonas pyrrhocoris]|uniref:Chloride channel protein n=1 Tax=Leptomonas pyrrhocoris TaxID=157538 RepID=A0A0N0VHB8_LEPPY|nr:putative chloride channel protein [Leptomonas pyrrhocoris]KPA84978.1 putative chloride channel protein [Leptomonas pyrrhocoris]|eukprot:XP_015663417.1 putative chloride channel protein [Leptomonas pyrrhocoris]